MRLAHQFTVPAPVEVVWSALLDPERVAPCMPGATLTEVDGPKFAGTVKVKLGPISLLYRGSGEFVDTDDRARSTVIKAMGRDIRGNGTASATVAVSLAQGHAGTEVSVTTDLNVTGRPAQFGRGLIAEISGKLVAEFAACLATRLGSAAAGGDDTVTIRHYLRAVPDQPEAEPIDLMGAAGVPVLKRVLPLALAAVVLLAVVLRRRRNRRA